MRTQMNMTKEELRFLVVATPKCRPIMFPWLLEGLKRAPKPRPPSGRNEEVYLAGRTWPIALRMRRLLQERWWTEEHIWLEEVARLMAKAHLANPPTPGAIKERRQAPDRFGTTQDVKDWCEAHKILLPRREWWWFVNARAPKWQTRKIDPDTKKPIGDLADLPPGPPPTVTVRALPKLTGVPKITNGIDTWVEMANGECFKAHKDNLKWNRPPRVNGAKPRSRRDQQLLDDLAELL